MLSLGSGIQSNIIGEIAMNLVAEHYSGEMSLYDAGKKGYLLSAKNRDLEVYLDASGQVMNLGFRKLSPRQYSAVIWAQKNIG